MLDTTKLTLFLITAFVILVTPGPAVIYIIAQSVDQGRLAGVVSTLGVGFGTMFHVAAAALGTSALLATSATAFSVLENFPGKTFVGLPLTWPAPGPGVRAQ
jgi:threonine/homoserine/homoserine lactone efflux protein